MNTYYKIKEIGPTLYMGLAVWLANKEQGKPLKDYYSPLVSELLGNNLSNGGLINKQLKHELFQRISQIKDSALVDALSQDIIELLYSEISIPANNYSLLGLFYLYSDHLYNRQDLYNSIRNDRNLRNDEEKWAEHAPFLHDTETILYIKKALFNWSETLINHIRKTTPHLFKEYEERFREIIDFQVPNVPPPATSTPVASDKQVKTKNHVRICLIRYFEKKPISASNAPEVAVDHDLPGKYAWKPLLKKYDNRFGDEISIKEYRGIAKHIEAVLECLSADARNRAEKMLTEIINKPR